MSDQSNPLFDLLPAIHRIRDAEQGGPSRELLDVITDQLAVLEEDLEQLYDDQFIETCADWVVPYLGDLIGYRSLHHKSPRLGSPRAEVANTIGYRRRKGTAAMLEQLARDVTGWPAKVVEFFQLLATTQFMNHVRIRNALAPDLRRRDPLESLDGPFDTLAHSVDTRRISTGDGRHNIPNIGIFLWRLPAQRLGRSPAVGLDAQRFLFSPLGNNTPLFTRPETEPSVTHLARPLNVPAPISRRRMAGFLADYYGVEKSVLIEGVTLNQVMVCDLSDHGGGWAHTPPPAGNVAIDPVLGRVAFGVAPLSAPLVTFHYGFSAELGGGEYERTASFAEPKAGLPGELPLLRVPDDHPNIGLALNNLGAQGGVIEITDNRRYTETISLNLSPGERVELRAADGRRPTIVLGGELVISGGDKQAEVTLSGLLLIGARLRVTAALRQLRLRHCTLVPGLSLDIHGVPQQPGHPSLIIESAEVAAEVDHCIVGGIRWQELSRLEIRDSIVDATDNSAVALAGPGAVAPGQLSPMGGTLRVEDCTVIGKVHARGMELVSNSILHARTEAGDGWPAPVLVQRKQSGCVRFSFVPDGARTPRRFRCQPDLEIALRIETAEKEAQGNIQSLPQPQQDAIRAEVNAWLKPSFTSLRYGEPAYGQLRSRSPRQIREGADDEASMGAFHDLFEPQRMINVQVRLKEYLRFGLEAGVFTVT